MRLILCYTVHISHPNSHIVSTTCLLDNDTTRSYTPCLFPQDTHFKLLGIYKEKDYTEWFEQLFKHEGYCIWNDDEYNFMQTYRNLWPQACTQTGYTTSEGSSIYYDLKPLSSGDMSIGLYTDYKCYTEYTEKKYSVEDILSAYGGNNNNNNNQHNDNNNNNGNYDYSSLSSYLYYWNNLMSVYKTCQPCKAYSLYNYEQEEEHGHRELNDYQYNEETDPNNGKYQCKDDAGYVNVNQCTKFRSKTEMSPVSFRELMLANQQDSLVRVSYHGVALGQTSYAEVKGLGLIEFAVAYFFVALFAMVFAWKLFKIRRERFEKAVVEERQRKKAGH
jgi:hypothetical protein